MRRCCVSSSSAGIRQLCCGKDEDGEIESQNFSGWQSSPESLSPTIPAPSLGLGVGVWRFGFGDWGLGLEVGIQEVQGLLLSTQLLISINSKIPPVPARCSKPCVRYCVKKWVRTSVTAQVKHPLTSREFNCRNTAG